MGTLFAMTLPALVVALCILGILDILRTRRARRSGDDRAQAQVGGAAIDVLGTVFQPSLRHKREHDEYLEIKQDDDGDAAPPRSRVDLDAGVARIVVPRGGAGR
jgi:hypothetical protein